MGDEQPCGGNGKCPHLGSAEALNGDNEEKTIRTSALIAMLRCLS